MPSDFAADGGSMIGPPCGPVESRTLTAPVISASQPYSPMPSLS